MPNWKTFSFDMTNAGEQDIDIQSGVFRFYRAEDANGALTVIPKVTLKIGDEDGESLILGVGNALISDNMRSARISWEAHPGVTAHFFRSNNQSRADVDSEPAVKQVVGALASSMTVAKVDVGVAEVEAIAANGDRKSLTIQAAKANSAIVEIIPSGTAFGEGLELEAGESYTTTTGGEEIYVISDTADQAVRVQEES